jgi:hypothetical protein
MHKRIKTIQLAVGCDLIGSNMSLSAERGTILELTPYGVEVRSKKTKRVIGITFANIKAMEFYPEIPDQVKAEPEAETEVEILGMKQKVKK